MKTRTILFVASRSDIAGGENYLLLLFKYMDRTKWHPIVWLPGDGAFREALEKAGVEYVVEPVDYGWVKPPKPWYEFLSGLPGRARRLAELLRERDVALVHTNSNMILEGALASRLVGVPHLYLAHIDFQPNLPIYQRFPLAGPSFAKLMDDLSEEIVAVSRFVGDMLCPPLPDGRVHVIHNGIELERFDQALAARDDGLRAELGVPQDAVLVAAAGRITEDKGFDYLIAAAEQVLPQHPGAYVLIAGGTDSSEYRAALETRVRESGLGERVRFLGLRRDLPRVLAGSDVFVLSSRREGHPYVLLEAMASECAAVASRCGGVDETVIEGETGFVVEVGDVSAMSARLDQLLGNPDLRRRMASKAREHVRDHFQARQSAEKLFAFYENMLAQPRPVPGNYAVDLALQFAAETGYLGERLTSLEERVKKTERAAQLLLDNPVTRLVRRILGR